MSPSAPLPILTGRVAFAEPYLSLRRRSHSPTVPARDAAAHRAMLESQLEQIRRAVGRRGFDDRDPAARNEIVAITPAEGATLPAESFGDSRYGIRVISHDPVTGVVLVDAARYDLPNLQRKVEQYGDDRRVSEKTGQRRGAKALNPIEDLRLASLEDLMGAELRTAIDSGALPPAALRWFELGCRGGRRERTLETDRSRDQIRRGLERLGRQAAVEFLAAEQLVLFARISLDDLRTLIRTTDCIYEVELVTDAVRDWLHFEHGSLPSPDFRRFLLLPPQESAAAVTLLDTGIASGHPMLRAAIAGGYTVVPHDNSPEDLHGHGTLMAGVALHDDVGLAVDRNEAAATHWLESVKLLTTPEQGSAAEGQERLWPVLTQRAVETAEAAGARRRIFAMAVTASLRDPARATLWSHAVDQFAYNDGHGRLFCVSLGNCDEGIDPLFAQGYPHMNLRRTLDDPAHAVNALSVGAYTTKSELTRESREGDGLRPLAPEGGVSPLTRAGVSNQAIKPDVVFEGGNLAFDGTRAYNNEATLSTLTTNRDILTQPLGLHFATSAATAQAARFAARVWDVRPELRPETVRGLLVHSARWTPQMEAQLPNLDERLRLCGYGVPDLSRSTECLLSRATLIVEDEMPNLQRTLEEGEERGRRVVKYVRLPVPEETLLADPDQRVELSVTLSYFGEPSTFRQRERLGLRLGWRLQGPAETADEFRARINAEARPSGDEPYVRTRGFDGWAIGPQRRDRGTVQSDRLRAPASLLAGDKLIAVYPVLGWWDDRNDTREERLPYSLIVSLEVPGKDIYTPISLALAASVEIDEP